jgi:hypothetical protein
MILYSIILKSDSADFISTLSTANLYFALVIVFVVLGLCVLIFYQHLQCQQRIAVAIYPTTSLTCGCKTRGYMT